MDQIKRTEIKKANNKFKSFRQKKNDSLEVLIYKLY